jgi:hypothetical protein
LIPTNRFAGGITLVNLGDIHRGNNFFDGSLLAEHISRIEDDKNTYWVSTGDMLETAIKSSKSSCYEASTPQEELEALAAELRPIRKKCLGFVASNHQNRIKKDVGLSLDKYLAAEAKIPFLGIGAVIKVVCDRAAYFIKMHHGVGGGTDGNKVNRAMKLAQNTLGADLYLTGHTHSFSYVQDVQNVIDRKRDKLTNIISHHVTTGHYLKYKGCYAEDMGLKEKPRGCAVVHLAGASSGNQCRKQIKIDFWGTR